MPARCIPNELKRNRNARAYTLMDLLAGAAFLALLAAAALPALVRQRGCHAYRLSCSNNLKQIGLSFRQCALDLGDKFPMQVSTNQGGTMELVASGAAWVHFRVMSNELNTPKIVFCPQEKGKGKIVATTFGTAPFPSIPFTNDNSVSYFVGVDAKDTHPSMWLAGDANLGLKGKAVKPGLFQVFTNDPVIWSEPRHENQGWLAFVDGSVDSAKSFELRKRLTASGVATNRLAVP